MVQNLILLDGDELKSLLKSTIDETLLNCGQQLAKFKEEKKFQKPFYTFNEVCNILGISRPTLYKMQKKFNLEWSKIGNQFRIPCSDIDKLLSLTGKEYSNAQ